MNFLFIFLKCLIILGVNIGFGWFISYVFQFYLFHPRKIYLFGKFPFYFSPGLLYRGKAKLINYLHQILIDYFEYVKEGYNHINFLTDFEKKMYKDIFPFLKKYLDMDWMPDLLKNKLNVVLSTILWMVIRHLTRSVFPRILIEINMECKIDLLDLKLDVNKLKFLFDKYFYNLLLAINLSVFAIAGMCNVLLFFILWF